MSSVSGVRYVLSVLAPRQTCAMVLSAYDVDMSPHHAGYYRQHECHMDHRTPIIVDHVSMREPDLNIGIYDLSHHTFYFYYERFYNFENCPSVL